MILATTAAVSAFSAPPGGGAPPGHFDLDARLERLSTVQRELDALSQEDADRLFFAIGREAEKHRLPLAELAVTESGMGVVEDKVIKNSLVLECALKQYAPLRTCGLISDDKDLGIAKYAVPVGPIAALVPCTNPTSTVILKAMMAAKSRNAMLFLPHPRTSRCSAEAVRICREAVAAAGGPDHMFDCVDQPSVELTTEIMRHAAVRLVLATGGPGMVKAAHASGTPTLAVGSGNSPAYVHATANVEEAVAGIIQSKCFDNGLICASENAVVAAGDTFDRVVKCMQGHGVAVLDDESRERLQAYMLGPKGLNPGAVGQTAQALARAAGIVVHPSTLVLAGSIETIGPDDLFAREKLAPVLGLYKAGDHAQALEACRRLVDLDGRGHTASVWGDESVVGEFASSTSAGHVFHNMPTALGAVGGSYNFNVPPSLTLGVGTRGGSVLSENLTPLHLTNTQTVATRQAHAEWFKVPPAVYFNRNCMGEALDDLSRWRGRRALIVTDAAMVELGHARKVAESLESRGFSVRIWDEVKPDPEISTILSGASAARDFGPEVIVGLGGGSPMDAAKAVRLWYEYPEAKLEDLGTRFIELRRRTHAFPEAKRCRLVLIPTTSGTGSEVSPFTVIGDGRTKYPLFSYRLTADMAIVDSQFCDKLPRSLVANAGYDAVVHALEAYVSVAANDFTRSHAIRALKLLFDNLSDSFHGGGKGAREAVHNGASIAGLAFGNSYLGVCHAISHKVGGKFHTPHGLTNAVLMPHVVRYNADPIPTKLGYYPNKHTADTRHLYAQVARLTGVSQDPDDAKAVEALVGALERLRADLHLPSSFREAGVPEDAYRAALDELARDSFDDQCIITNPRMPLISEIRDILEKAL